MADKSREDEIALAVQALNQSPFYRFIKMQVVKIGEGVSEVHLQLQPEYKNIWGLIHGGVAATLLDTSCGTSLYSLLEQNEGAWTIDLHTSFLGQIREGLMIGRGKAVYRTRNLAWSQAEAFDQEGNLVARGNAIHRVIKR